MNGLHISILSNFFAFHNIPSSKSKIFIDILNSRQKAKDQVPAFKGLTARSGVLVGTHAIMLMDALVIHAVRESRRKERSEERSSQERSNREENT